MNIPPGHAARRYAMICRPLALVRSYLGALVMFRAFHSPIPLCAAIAVASMADVFARDITRETSNESAIVH